MAVAEPFLRAARTALEAIEGAGVRLVSPRVSAALAIGLGVGLSTIASRADDPTYDEAEVFADRVLADRVRAVTVRIELPEDFQLVQASRLEPVDPFSMTVFLDARGLHVGDQSFDLARASLVSFCSVPKPVSEALEWERRVARAVDPGDRAPWQEKVNLAIDARTPYRNVLTAWQWLRCAGLAPALVFADPARGPGVLEPDSPMRGGFDVRFRVAVAPDGYRVERGSEREEARYGLELGPDFVSRTVSYGVDCAPHAEGPAVSLHAGDAVLAECVLHAMDDEAEGVRFVTADELNALDRKASGLPPPPPLSREERRRRLYPTCGNSASLSYAVSSTPEAPFRDVAHAVLSARDVLSFAGFSLKP